jgi:ABC-type Na+ efflux pump permease subunit
MIEHELKTPSVEEASEELSDEVSVDTAVSVEELTPAVDYLSPELFQDIKSYSKEDMDQEEVEEEIPAELQTKYLETLSDIDEQELVTGRVIGMTALSQKESSKGLNFPKMNYLKLENRSKCS